MHTKAIENIAK